MLFPSLKTWCYKGKQNTAVPPVWQAGPKFGVGALFDVFGIVLLAVTQLRGKLPQSHFTFRSWTRTDSRASGLALIWYIFFPKAAAAGRLINKMSTANQKLFTVLVEGNIGSGKTTFLEHFQQFEDVTLLTEPVEAWRNLRGWNLLVSKIWLYFCV